MRETNDDSFPHTLETQVNALAKYKRKKRRKKKKKKTEKKTAIHSSDKGGFRERSQAQDV